MSLHLIKLDRRDNLITVFQDSIMSTLEKKQSVLSICSGSQTVDIRAPTIKMNNERRNHNHISIHPMQLQQTTCPYESMSFDQSFGLDTVNPTYGLNTKFSDFRSSFTSTLPVINDHQTQNWHLEDSDMLTPLPENMLYGVDLEQIEKINDNELDGIVPVTDQISNNLKVTSEDQPMTKLPKKSNPKNPTLQNNIPDHSPANPNVLRPRIIAKLVKEAERKLGSQNFQQRSHRINPQSNREKSMIKMGQDRIQQKAPRKVISHTATGLPVTKAAKATQTCSQGDDAMFQRERFNRIHEFMKKLDVQTTIFSTQIPPYEALKIAQQRQIWLQAWNRIMADVNVSESADIFGLYFRYPFQPVPKNPKVPQKRKKPNCNA